MPRSPCKEAPSSPPLAFLAPRLHLATFVLASNHIELGHFLRHYIGKVGAWANQTTVFVRVDRLRQGDRELNITLDILRERGVGDVRVITAPSSDAMRFRYINERIAQAAAADSSAWFIYADVDEFFSFPGACAMREHIEQMETPGSTSSLCFRATMCDMLANNLGIPPLSNATDIEEQYPFGCRVRQLIGRFNPTKIALHRILTLTSPSRLRDFGSAHTITEIRGKMQWYAASHITHVCHFRRIAPHAATSFLSN